MGKRRPESALPLIAAVSKPWTIQLLLRLLERPHRFSDLRAAVPGLSAKIMTERLRELEALGAVTRHYATTIPPTVTYTISIRGHSLEPFLRALSAAAEIWSAEGAPESASACCRRTSALRALPAAASTNFSSTDASNSAPSRSTTLKTNFSTSSAPRWASWMWVQRDLMAGMIFWGSVVQSMK